MEVEQFNDGVILVVDDDAGFRDAVEEVLRDAGYAVAKAENGETALCYLRSHPAPAMILLDLRMPVMNGWAFRMEQQQDPELACVPVVVVAAPGEPELSADGPGSAERLQKPVDISLLLNLVRRHCG